VRPRHPALAALPVLASALLCCSACGASAARPHRQGAAASSLPAAPAACAETVASTLGVVAARIYRQAAGGRDVAQAVHRLTNSATLSAAARAGSASATRAALNALLLGQIARVEVLRGGRVLAAAGSGAAVAPVAGTLPGSAGARYVLSVQSDRTYTQVTSQVTGAQVLLLAGARRVAGTIALPASARVPASGALTVDGRSYGVASLPAAAYPAGALRIALLVPASELTCPANAAPTRAAVLGRVGERIYEAEQHSAVVAATVRRMENTGAFRAAVERHDAQAARQAILGFFAAHIHVVRVRVLVRGRLLVDVGGPYALAPVTGTLRSGGRVLGSFVTAIQDDAGYLKLARLFTGAQVLMRLGSKQIMGTLDPGPSKVPDDGTVAYRGHTYEAHSFTATAFPSGPLRISLLF
jgi:hypothetical protein